MLATLNLIAVIAFTTIPVQLAVVAYIAKNDVLYKREFNLIFHMY
jgi:hypothetical protein